MLSKSNREQCHSAATYVNSAPDPLAITEIPDDLAGAFEDVAIDVLVYRITDLDHPVVVYWGEIPLRYFLSLFRDANTKLPYIFQRLLGLEDYVGGFPSYAHGARSLMEIVAVTDVKLDEKSTRLEPVTVLPDILAYLQKETELTRHTLVQILKRSGRLGDFKVNPQQFMALAGREISRALHDLMLKGIQYEKIAGQHWEMSRIEQEAEEGISRYLSNLYEVQHKEKCLFDHIEFDSEVEKQFARDLDNNENVKLFVKLPKWFKIDTPIGPYNPDWAFVTERDERLYFVRETKSTVDKEELRNKETQKIECGRRHFEAIDVDYDVVTKLSEVAF